MLPLPRQHSQRRPGHELDGDPPGAILPLGGTVGHKGYALAFMIDILAGALSGAGCCQAGTPAHGDGMLAMAIDVQKFSTMAD